MDRSLHRHAAFAAALALGSLAPAPRAGQVLFASDPAYNAEFGYRLCQRDDTLVVGAPYASPGGLEEAGEVYVFVREHGLWSQQALLLASDAGIHTFFGGGLALDGNTLLVGAGKAPVALSSSGAVHVLVRKGGSWSEQAVLLQPAPTENSWFGMRLALQGDTAIIGAQQATLPGLPPVSGAVYVFQRTGTSWSLVQTLHAPVPQDHLFFGAAVALDGDTLMIAAAGYATPLEFNSVYVFGREDTRWRFQQQIFAPPGETLFKDCIVLHGDTAMLSAEHAGLVGQIDEESVHVYQRTGSSWEHQAKLSASEATGFASFGNSVDFHGDRALVGAGTAPPSGGAAYLFERQGEAWVQVAKFVTTSSYKAGYFGGRVALSRDEVIIAASADKAAGPSASGAVYVRALAEGLTPWADIGFTLPGQAGASYLSSPSTLAPGTDVALSLAGAQGKAKALLMISPSAALLPFKGGTLVPGPPLAVIPGKTDSWGDLQLSMPWPNGVPAGLKLYFQYVLDDATAPQGVALSNALVATTP